MVCVRMRFPMAFTLLVWMLLLCGEHSAADRLHKRSDDSNPLETVVSRLSQDVANLQAELQAVKNILGKRAAFHSILTLATPPPNAPVHMTPVHEVGNGYDATSGMYVAPYSGWYSVDFQLFPNQKPASYFDVDLYKNGDIVARARCDDANTYVTCKSGVTLHLTAGEKLWLQSDFGIHFYTAVFDNLFTVVLVVSDD